MTSDFNVRLAKLQNSYETLKNEIGEFKKIFLNYGNTLEGHVKNLSSRINNNNDLHLSNFNQSKTYLDDVSEKIKSDIKSFEKVQDNMANIYLETLGNRISLDNIKDDVKSMNKTILDNEGKQQQQKNEHENFKTYFNIVKNDYDEVNNKNFRSLSSHENIINDHVKALNSIQCTQRLSVDNFNVIHDKINSIVSTMESLHRSLEKSYLNHYEDINTLEKKLTEYIDKKITSLPKVPSKFETSPQVLDELKTLGLNIKNLVMQKNTLEINCKKQEDQLKNLTQQIQSIKG
jgi:hypothetical protein